MFEINYIFVINFLTIFSKLCISLSIKNYTTLSEVNSANGAIEEAHEFEVETKESNQVFFNFEKPSSVNNESVILNWKNNSYLKDRVFIPVAVTNVDLNDFNRKYQNILNFKGILQHKDVNDNATETAYDNEKSKKVQTTKGFFSEAGNNTIIIKNGKKYKVVKVKKKFTDPKSEENEKKKFQPLSHSPGKWSVKNDKNQSNDIEETTDNWNFWSKIYTMKIEKNYSNSSLENGDKIKKLLNLFTIVKIDSKECFVNGMTGLCLHQLECEQRGMKYASTCAEDLGVCCYYGITCGEQSNQSLLYLSSDQFLNNLNSSNICTLIINKSDPDVIQFRIEFLDFRLKGPTNGTCLHDRLVFIEQNSNSIIPEICGVNTGQHLYIHVQDSDGPLNLNFITMGEYFPRSFRLKVTQLKNGDEFASPKNCLQYFIEPIGNLQTFNYHHDYHEISDASTAGYFNNLNYAICIKKLKGICSISYENEEVYETKPTFQFLNMDADGENLLPPLQAGAETFDCPDDYIIIGGLRLCGEKLNDVSIDVDLTKNYPVTDTSNGPFIVFVRTDSAINGRGLNIKYTQNLCSP